MKTILRSPIFTVALFVLAAALLGFGTVGAVQAAPRITSPDYRAQVQMTDIGTSLIVNGTPVSDENALLSTLLTDNNDTKLKIGKTYKTSMAVRNTGAIEEYVRVTVRAYWTTKDGSKELDVDPSLIKIGFGSGWKIDSDATNAASGKKGERTVLYYDGALAPGADTSAFIDSVTIDGAVVTAMTDGAYDYKDLQFRIEATADAVQTHNGDKARISAWGKTG